MCKSPAFLLAPAPVLALALALAAILGGCGVESAGPVGGVAEASTGPFTLQESRPLAGTLFTIEVVTHHPDRARQAVDAAFAEAERLEAVVSEWQDDSEISRINRTPNGRPVSLSAELFGVISRALWFAEQTDGAFDPSYAGCASRWSIPERRIPDVVELAECQAGAGFRSIRMDALTPAVSLEAPGMRIGLGGIGKGYRVDRAAEVLEAHGLTSYAVNGGGDIRVSAGELHGPWEIEIIHPRDTQRTMGRLSLEHGAVATSGDTSWFFEQDGERYHHIFDPRTGKPARESIAVTVITERAIDADALATGLFVLGPEAGLALLEQLPGYEALLVDPELKIHRSAGFPDVQPANQGAL
jgi:thiamine biosynthesis lipoprotein